jgi:hexosaminidase
VPSLGSGPYKNPDKSMGTGYYRRDTFIQLLQYAAEHHMDVIPEIDLPGHAHAAIVAINARYDRLSQAGKSEQASEYLLYHPEDTSRYESVQKWKNNAVDVGMESTYRFVEKIVSELDQMYKDAGLELTMMHIGGDEVSEGAWKGSPACHELIESDPEVETHYDLLKYFVSRASHILNTYDIRTAGWEEIGMKIENGKKVPNAEFARYGFVPYVWNSVWGWGAEDLAYRMANEGFDVVLSNVTNLYLDLAYNKHPREPGLYWGGFVDTRTTWEFTLTDVKLCAETDLYGHPIDVESFDRFEPLREDAESHIIGIQGQLWGENARSRELLHYLMFPEALGLAERAWAKEPQWEKQSMPEKREKAWNRFITIVGARELPRLARKGIAYRIPLPGAIVRNDTLHINNMYPGLNPVFQLGNKPADTYSAPVSLQGREEIDRIQIWNRDNAGRESRKSVIFYN